MKYLIANVIGIVNLIIVIYLVFFHKESLNEQEIKGGLFSGLIVICSWIQINGYEKK